MKKHIFIIVLISYSSFTFCQGVGINDDGSMPAAGTMLDIKGATDDNTTYGLQVRNSSGNIITAIRNDGNVGIGTTSPIAKLDILGAGNNGAALFLQEGAQIGIGGEGIVQGTPTGYYKTSGNFGIQVNSPAGIADPSNYQLFIERASGNVGIATTSPDASLDVNANASFSGDNISIGSVTGATGERANINYNGTGARFTLKGTAGVNTSIGANGTDDYLYVKTDGNVGIATTSPTQKLDVEGTAQVNYLTVDPQDGTNEGGEIQLKGAGVYGAMQIDNFQGHMRIHTLAAGKLFQILGGSIYTTGTANNYFASNVGIGTTTPSQALDINGSLQIRNTSGTYTGVFHQSTGVSSITQYRMASDAASIFFHEEDDFIPL